MSISAPKHDTIIDHRRRVQRAMIYIDQNLDQVCPVARLAQEACLSPFHFTRVFASCSGETPKQYWLRNRLLHAAHCLAFTNRKVIDIAVDIGYESHNAFSKAFKKWYGVSPRAFRDAPMDIDDWGYDFNGYRAFRPFPTTNHPAVYTIVPRQFIYLEAEGF